MYVQTLNLPYSLLAILKVVCSSVEIYPHAERGCIVEYLYFCLPGWFLGQDAAQKGNECQTPHISEKAGLGGVRQVIKLSKGHKRRRRNRRILRHHLKR